MRIASAALLGLVLVCTPAAAQQDGDSVRTHYRAYNDAVARGDFAAAETEAAAALAASEAVNGARTGVLAINLAQVRILRNDFAGALAPAQRAVQLAEAGATGVDLTHARLLLGRAELATSGQPGADRLAALLAQENLAAPETQIFPAATELSYWALTQRQLDLAETAAVIAGEHAAGSEYGDVVGLGRARTLQATAIFMEEIGRRGGGRMSRDGAANAYRTVGEALVALTPALQIDPPPGVLTVAQIAYAQAAALRGAITAKAHADDVPLPDLSREAEGDADGAAELGPRNISQPRCLIRINAPRQLDYPAEEIRGGVGGVGAVTLWIRLDEAGQVSGQTVVARIGSDAFAEEVASVRGWLVSRQEESPANCRMPRTVLRIVSFGVGRP